MNRTIVGFAILPASLSAAALGSDGSVMGTADGQRGEDLAADVDALLASLGKRVPGIARGKFRAAIGWGGPSVLAVVETNGAGGKARDAAVRSTLEAEAGRSLDGWRIAWASPSGAEGSILAGAAPEEEILAIHRAVESAGGEAVGADLLPLVLVDAVQAEDKKREASLLAVLLPGSVSLFLIDGKGTVASCRHRFLNGGDTEDRAETEVMRGLVAWEGAEGAAPKRLDLIDAGGLAGRLAEKVTVPVREVSLEEIVQRVIRGRKAKDAPSDPSRLALIAARLNL